MPLAVLPAIIGAATSIGGSLLSSRSARKAEERARQDPLAIAQRQLLEQQAVFGREQGDLARSLFPKYTEGVNYLSDYWRRVLSDDNREALAAISPGVRARQSQTQAGLQRLQFAPRGSTLSNTFQTLYDTEQADILSMLLGERSNARTSYAGLIGDVGARAQGLYGGASGSTSSAISGLGQQLQRQDYLVESARARTQQTMSGINDALASFLDWYLNRGDNSEGGGNNSSRSRTSVPGATVVFGPR